MTTPPDALILAGGRGTRSRAYLGNTPKFLAPVARYPLCDHLLVWLAMAGIRRVVLALSAGEGGAAAIVSHLHEHPVPGLELHAAIAHAPTSVPQALAETAAWVTSDTVLVMNGDTLIDLNLQSFCALEIPEGYEYETIVEAGQPMSQGFVSAGLFHTKTSTLSSWPARAWQLRIPHDFVDVGTEEGWRDAQSWPERLSA